MSSWQTLARIQASLQAPGSPHERLRHHVTGAIDRGEKTAIVEVTEPRPAAAVTADLQASHTTPDSSPVIDTAELGRPVGKRFVLAGHAIVTLVGESSRYTFKITRKDPEEGSRYTEPAYFVALLTGPDNTADYTYVGLLNAQLGTIQLTRKSTYRDASIPVRAFNWTIGRLWRGLSIEPAKVLHAGRCGRCGRLLTVPTSVESGFGPECIGKVGA